MNHHDDPKRALHKAIWLPCFTDSAKGHDLGFGGVFRPHWLFGHWKQDFIKREDPSIEFLELYGLVVAVFVWSKELINRRIVVFCDNQAIVNMINNNSSSCQFCMKLIRMLVLLSLKRNMRIFAKWVRGSLNIQADLLSRQ